MTRTLKRALVVLIASALALSLTGCLGGIGAKRQISKVLLGDHPGFRVVSLERVRAGNGDGLGDRYDYVIASEKSPDFRIGGTIRMEGQPHYIDRDIISNAADSPYRLTAVAKQRFIGQFTGDFPGKTYYPNETIGAVTEAPAAVRDDLVSGVQASGDPKNYYLIQYEPKDRANRLLSDVEVSALYYLDPKTSDWNLVAKKAGDFITEAKKTNATKSIGFASARALMEAVVKAINDDPSKLVSYYDPVRVANTEDRTSFPPAEEIRRNLLESFRFSKLAFDIVQREDAKTGMTGVELRYRGRIFRNSDAVRVVDIASIKGSGGTKYYIERIDRVQLLPK